MVSRLDVAEWDETPVCRITHGSTTAPSITVAPSVIESTQISLHPRRFRRKIQVISLKLTCEYLELKCRSIANQTLTTKDTQVASDDSHRSSDKVGSQTRVRSARAVRAKSFRRRGFSRTEAVARASSPFGSMASTDPFVKSRSLPGNTV